MVPAVAGLVVLGLGAWSATYLLPPGDQVADSTPVATIPTTLVTPPTTTPGPEPTPTSDPPTATDPPTTAAPPESTAPPAPPAPSAPPGVDDRVLAFEQEVVALVNAERARAGCAALTEDARLTAAARAHSADMAARGYFSHTTPDGVEFHTRISNAGYSWSLVAENIARGQRDPAAVMNAWMNSDGHRRNILNCNLRHIGVGLAYDANNRPHWTQDFGSPR